MHQQPDRTQPQGAQQQASRATTEHVTQDQPQRDQHPSPRSARQLGQRGEWLAARHLVDAGMVLIDHNWSCPAGEIDLVLRDRDVLVVCEVKTRRSTAYGSPLEAVTPAKAARLRRLAAQWVAAHDLRPREIRIDLVGILARPGVDPVIEHVTGVG